MSNSPLTPYTIRDAVADDLDVLMVLAADYLELLATIRGQAMQAGWRGNFKAYLRGVLKQQKLHLRVLDMKGQVAGFCIFGHEPEPLFEAADTGYIYDLYVFPDVRKTGCGRALVRDAESVMKKNSVASVSLSSFRGNTGANLFWQACGYAPGALRFEKRLE
ncbi:GNAT family N-acetyltransferase [Planctomycetota bacterium]